MAQDEETLANTTETLPNGSWHAHLWHRESRKRPLHASNAADHDNRRHAAETYLALNGALAEFGPTLVDRMEFARKRYKELYLDPTAFYAIFDTLMKQFEPELSRDPNDATAGAIGWIVYLYKTTGQTSQWQMHCSEVPLSNLLFDADCLLEDWATVKREQSIVRWEKRWIHLPANNMEWVELIMERAIEAFLRRNKDDPAPVSPEAMAHVIHHVLLPKRWTARQNDRSPQMLHARFMDSLTQQFTVASKTSDQKFAALSGRSFVIFMPYLSWERSTVATYRNIVYEHAHADAERLSIYDDGRIRVPSDIAASNTAKIPCCEREALLRNYLFTKKPLHLRRTLDQSYYTVMSDTRHRDEDQVVERHARKQTHWGLRDRIDPCILMVDHLWLWVLNKDTIITCFPKTWKNTSEFDGSDLFELVRARIVKKLNKHDVKPADVDMGRMISETCAMYMRKLSKHSKCHQFMRFFEDSLRKVKDDESRFHRDIAGDLRSDKAETDENFLDITKEFRALGELMDITDEVHMILHIIDEQIEVMTELDNDLFRTRGRDKTGEKPEWRVLSKLKSEKLSWEKILKKANETRNEIRDLLELKQQHATIKLATDTSHQSNSIMLFTMVTIVFLPLSTLASIFGVNASTFGQGNVSLSTMLAYIFPISVVVILLTVWLAFNHTARRCVTLTLEILFTLCKFYIPGGIFEDMVQSLADNLQNLRARRRVKTDARLAKKKRKRREEQEEAKRQHQKTSNLLRRASRYDNDEDDDEFEEDSNVDITEFDRVSTSLGME